MYIIKIIVVYVLEINLVLNDCYFEKKYMYYIFDIC